MTYLCPKCLHVVKGTVLDDEPGWLCDRCAWCVSEPPLALEGVDLLREHARAVLRRPLRANDLVRYTARANLEARLRRVPEPYPDPWGWAVRTLRVLEVVDA